MRRRDFIAASTAALAAGSVPGFLRAGEESGRDVIELRVYRFATPAKLAAFDGFLGGPAKAALERADVGPLGVFTLHPDMNPTVDEAARGTTLYVVFPHRSAKSAVGLFAKLASDQAFLAQAGSVILAPKADPAYLRFESSLLLGFRDAPRVETPVKSASRLLQLRIYESHSEERHYWKVHMFNEGGEIAIFRRCGLNPVFFGQAMVGSRLPNLTYMVGFESKEAMDKAWATFGADPDWNRIKGDPMYADTVSNITNLVLKPTAASTI